MNTNWYDDERSPRQIVQGANPLSALEEQSGQEPRAIERSIAGEAGDTQDLSAIEEVNEESVEELAATGQAIEAAAVEGVEDAADHPERPVHTHEEYGRPDDAPPAGEKNAA